MCCKCGAAIPEKQARAISVLRLGGVHKISEYCQSCYGGLERGEKTNRKKSNKKRPW